MKRTFVSVAVALIAAVSLPESASAGLFRRENRDDHQDRKPILKAINPLNAFSKNKERDRRSRATVVRRSKAKARDTVRVASYSSGYRYSYYNWRTPARYRYGSPYARYSFTYPSFGYASYGYPRYVYGGYGYRYPYVRYGGYYSPYRYGYGYRYGYPSTGIRISFGSYRPAYYGGYYRPYSYGGYYRPYSYGYGYPGYGFGAARSFLFGIW